MSDTQDFINLKEIKTVKFGMHDTDAQAQTSSSEQAACPAGGTGAAAGGWDTAAHRNEAILLINQIRTTLINNGMMKGSA